VRVQSFSDGGLRLLIKLAKRELTKRHRPQQEGSHVESTKYVWEDGRVISVERGIGSANSYMTMYQKPNKLSWKRFVRPELIVRGTRAEAQADLDVFAKQHDLQAAREDAPPEPEPATATTEQAQESKPLAATTTKEEETVLGWYSQGWSVNKIADWGHISKSKVSQIIQHAQTSEPPAAEPLQLEEETDDTPAFEVGLNITFEDLIPDRETFPETEPTTPPEPTPKPITDVEIAAYILRCKAENGETTRSLEQRLKDEGILNPETGRPYSKSKIDRMIQQARKEGKTI
jgi:hypothetical protein